MKSLQDLKISTNSADSRCTTNPWNRWKVHKMLYYYQIKGLHFNSIETSSQCTKQQKVK